LGVGHEDDEFVAFGAAYVREAYTRVACCAFDDGAAGFQEAALFGIFDDVVGGAVFDAAAGVLEFGFA